MKKDQEGYTMVFINSDDEIRYEHFDDINKLSEAIVDFCDAEEIEDENISCFVKVFKGKIEPLKLEYTRTVKIGN